MPQIESNMITLLQNASYKAELTKLLQECNFDFREWDNVAYVLANNDNCPLALISKARYYITCANNYLAEEEKKQFKAGQKCVSRACQSIELCLKLTGASKWDPLTGSRYITCVSTVNIPYAILFYDAAAILGLYMSSKKQSLSLMYFRLSQAAFLMNLNHESFDSLISFRRYSEFTLSDLIEQKVTVMPPRVMNDYFDSLFFPWLGYRKQHCNNRLKSARSQAEINNINKNLKMLGNLSDSMKNYRIRSFIKPNVGGKRNITNPLMWAHYAGEHKGLAIEYSFDISEMTHVDPKSVWRFGSIYYSKPGEVIDISKNSISLEKAFLTKSDEWRYEDEVRLMSYDLSSNDDYKQLKIGTIKAIYFGIRCPKQTIDTVKTLLRSYPSSVDFFQMEEDAKNIYLLKTKVV